MPEDLARGRVYIPQEDLRRFGSARRRCDGRRRMPGHGVQSREVKALLRLPGVRARASTTSAPTASLPSADARRLVAAEIMGAIYFAILEKIERGRLRRLLPRHPDPPSPPRADRPADLAEGA